MRLQATKHIMDRETTTIKTKNHSFEVKTYATAREVNAIQSVYFEGAKIEIVGETPKINEFNPSVQYNVQLATIEQLVVEMDGDKQNIKNRCEDLPSGEFDELTAQLDAIASKKN